MIPHEERPRRSSLSAWSRLCSYPVAATPATICSSVVDDGRPWREHFSTSPPLSTPTTTTPVEPSAPVNLGPGASGPTVLALQKHLASLGYWLGTPDGTFSDSTAQAICALQKAAHISRDGILGPATEAALAQGVLPHPRSSSGSVIEVDLQDDLLMFVNDGKLDAVLNTSTGGGYAYTDEGMTAVAETPPQGSSTSIARWTAWSRTLLGNCGVSTTALPTMVIPMSRRPLFPTDASGLVTRRSTGSGPRTLRLSGRPSGSIERPCQHGSGTGPLPANDGAGSRCARLVLGAGEGALPGSVVDVVAGTALGMPSPE